MASRTEIDRWTVAKLIEKIERKEVVLPTFQRGVVWNEQRRVELIESLSRGWPVGAILVADDPSSPTRLRLLDGLQRSTALQAQLSGGMEWVQEHHLQRDHLRRAATLVEVAEDVFCDWLLREIRARPRVEDVQEGDLAILALHEFVPDQVQSRSVYGNLREALAPIIEEIRRTLGNLKSAELPVIVFHSTDVSEQAAVFARLNSRGIPLSKLQILSAQWTEHTLPVGKCVHWDGIIDAVRARYADLEKSGFDVADYDAQSIRRSLGAFEFVFGLGKYLAKEYPELWSPSGATDEDGYIFSLLGAVLLRDATNSAIIGIGDHLLNLGRNKQLDALIESVHAACGVVRAALDRCVNMRLAGQRSSRFFHTELQMVAYVAVAFELRNRVEGARVSRIDNRNTREQENAFQAALLYRMLYDLMRGSWRSAGDRQVGVVMRSATEYLSRPTERMWRSAYGNWSQDRLTRPRERSARRKQPAGADALLLQLTYLSKLTFDDVRQQDLDWDHVVPAAQLELLARETGGLPMHVFANFGLLDKRTNMKKGNRTPTEYIASLQQDPERTMAEQRRIYDLLIYDSDWLDKPLTLDAYRKFLESRSDHIFEQYVLTWSSDYRGKSASKPTSKG